MYSDRATGLPACSCNYCTGEQGLFSNLVYNDLDNCDKNFALSAGACAMEHLVRVPFGVHPTEEIIQWLTQCVGPGRIFSRCQQQDWGLELAWETVSSTQEDRWIYVWFRSSLDQAAFILAWSHAQL